MAKRLLDTDFRVLKDNGDPASDGTLTFKLGGTNTSTLVYSDAGLSVSLGAVVNIGSDGYLENDVEVYGADDITYDVIIQATGFNGGAPKRRYNISIGGGAIDTRVAETFSEGNATPSVLNGADFITAGSTTITDFLNGVEGQIITIYRGDDDITIQHTADVLETIDEENITLTAEHPGVSFRNENSVWVEVSSSDAYIKATDTVVAKRLSDWAAKLEAQDIPQRFPIQAYAPAITHVAVDTGSSLYRHVPGIYMRDGAGAIAYQFNDSSADESQSGQRVGLRRTSDDGATWSSKVEELNSATYASTPLTVSAGTLQQANPWINYIDALDEEWLTLSHRVSEETAFLCRRDASAAASVNKWSIKRAMFDTTTMALVFSSTITGAAPGGYQLEATLDGVANLAPIMGRPVRFQDGRWAIPVTYVTTFGVLHRVGVFYSDAENPGDTDWKLSGLVPLGDFGAADMWEPTIVRTELGVYRMLIRDLSGSENAKYGVTESADLVSWSPAKHLGANVHTDRIEVRRTGSNRYLGVGVSHTSNRNGLSLMVSRDGALFSEQGLEVGNEIDGTDFVHYSDIDEDSSKIYVCFSKGTVASSQVTDIWFARFASFDVGALPMMGSVKNAVEDNDAAKESTVSGDILTIPPGAGMMWVPGGLATVFTRTWALEAAPASNPSCLFTIGAGASRKLVTVGTDGKIYADGVDTGIQPNDLTKKQTTQIMIDRRRRIARVYEIEFPIPSWSQLGSGDAYNDQTDCDGDIYFYASGCFDAAIEPDRLSNALGGISGHSSNLTVDNFLAIGPSASTLTIASGAITVTGSHHLIDTESAAASDDLDTINGGRDGDILILQTVSSSRDVTLKDGTGNIFLATRNRTLGKLNNRIMLQRSGGNWYMIGRSLDSDGVGVDFAVGGDLAVTGASTVTGRTSANGPLKIGAGANLTIASGAITVTHSNHKIDTEAAAASDDLDTITGGSDGDILVLSSVSSSRDLRLRSGIDNIFSQGHVTLAASSNRVVLIRDGGNWFVMAAHTTNVNTSSGYQQNGVQVLGAQGAAVADASGGATIDAEARTAINTLLARLRTHGMIAT